MIQIFLNLQNCKYKQNMATYFQEFINSIQGNKLNRRIQQKMQTPSKSSINLYSSQSKGKIKHIRKIPDPYLNLVHKNREYQRIQNSIKIYQNKKNLLKRKFQIKKQKITNIEQISLKQQDKQKKELNQDFRLSKTIHSNRSKNKTHHNNQDKQNRSNRFNTQDSTRFSLNSLTVSYKKKLQNHILNMAKQRKLNKQMNQSIMRLHSIESKRQNKIKKLNVLKFEENLHKKRQNLVKSYIDKVHKNQQGILKELKPLQLLKHKQIENMISMKNKMSDQICCLKNKNKSLNRQFGKILNLKSQSMVQHVMRSSFVSIR